MTEIVNFAIGHGSLLNAPHINHTKLKEMNFGSVQIDAIEKAIASSFDIQFVFNKWTLGETFCTEVLGINNEELNQYDFNMLDFLGFSEQEIEAANVYACGAMTIEGAPHIKTQHLNVFDCANPAVEPVHDIFQLKAI